MQNFDCNIGFWGKRHFFAKKDENRRKLWSYVTSIPDEFVKKIAQNVAQPVFSQNL
jgi:hypothetical protein